MSELAALDFGGREVGYFGEVIQDGLLDMLDAGRLASASATSLALTDGGRSGSSRTSSATPMTSFSARLTSRTVRHSSTGSAGHIPHDFERAIDW
jgi:acyl-CoA hydrolase